MSGNKTNSSVVNKSFRKKLFRNGSYSVGVSVLVLAIILVINLVIGLLPSQWTAYDLSPSLLYTIGDTTKDVVSDLDQDVDIFIIAESDTVDERIMNFLEKYAALSNHINVEQIDPILHPDVLSKYEVDNDNLVVSCDATGRFTNIPFSDIVVKELNQYYYYYYNETVYEETSFDGEGQVTSAIEFVTSNETHQMYLLNGHGEKKPGEHLLDALTKSNISTNDLNLMESAEIPDDCEVLLINGAVTDLNDTERDLILGYMAKGGQMVITLSGPTEKQPNLEAVLNDYGIKTENGYVYDPTRYNSNADYYAVLPIITDTASFPSLKSDSYTLMPYGVGISHVEGARSSLTYTDLMTTSSSGQLYINADESEGPDTYLLATSVSEVVNGNTIRMLVYASCKFIEAETVDQYSNIGNVSAFMDSIGGMFGELTTISIPAKSLNVSYNNIGTTDALTWGIIFFAVIPAAMIIVGFVIWVKRRRR